MPIDKSKLSPEMMRKALHCETADELLALAKANGVDITKEEAEAYIAELENQELDDEQLMKIAGGDGPYVDCFTDCLLVCVNRHT